MKMRRRKKRIYYSHPILFYNKPIEKKALRLISFKFKNVEIANPRNFHSLKMNDYCDIVKKCDILVAQPLSKKVLSAGVCKEIKTAFKSKIPVFCLDVNSGKIFKINNLDKFKCLNQEETILAFRAHYFSLLQRPKSRSDHATEPAGLIY